MDQHDVGKVARAAGDHPLVEATARAGYAANAVMHLVIGWLAAQLALQRPSGSTDQSGALQLLASTSLGQILLGIGLIGFAGLALWQVSEAAVPRPSLGDRLKAAGKGIVYALLAWSCWLVLHGQRTSSSGQSRELTAKLLASPFGVALVILLGLAVIAVGGYHGHKGWTSGFRKDLVEHPGSTVSWAGRIGYVLKGVALVLVGVFFVAAGLGRDTSKAGGLDTALRSLLDKPLGPALLLIIALGFVAYGIYSFFRAKAAKV